MSYPKLLAVTAMLALVCGVAQAQPVQRCGGVVVPSWNTNARPSGAVNDGTTGYNTTTGMCEAYSTSGGDWSVTTLNIASMAYAIRMDSLTAIVAAGSGYVSGDTITLNAGCTTNPVLAITATAGAVTNYLVASAGECSKVPVGTLAQLSTTGTGTGATFTFRFAPVAAYIPSSNSVAGGNTGSFNLGSKPLLGGNLISYGAESMFISPFMGDLRGNSSFSTVIGPGNCGAGSGAALNDATKLTCLGSNAGRNLADGSTTTIVIGNYGSAATPNWVGTSTVVISPGQTQNLTTSLQNTLINSGGGSLATGAGNLIAGPGAGATYAAVAGAVLLGGADNSGSNGGAKGGTKMVVLGGTVGNSGITGSKAFIVGYGNAPTLCTNQVGYLLIGSGNIVLDCIAGQNSYLNVENTIIQGTVAPTVSSGFGTSPTIPAGTSTGGFQVNVGTGGAASSGVIRLTVNNIRNSWACDATDTTSSATMNTIATSTNGSLVTLTNYSRTTGLVTAWNASDVITVKCNGF